MDDLPFEIKHMICASAMETSRETLQALSLVNHTWYQAAVPFLYEKLQLCLTTTPQLQEDVEQLMKHPLRKQYLRYLRRLDLVGRSGKRSLHLAALQEDAEGPIMLDNFLDRELWQRHTFRLCRGETTTPDYASLARFIAAVSNLRELNWVRALRFPQEVLDALHKYHPSCKLNLLYFYLQAWKYQGLSDNDMTVVTSPCLHTIRCYYYSNAGNNEVIESATLRSLSVASNLKKVDLVLVPEVDFVDQRIYRFEPTDGASDAIARLDTLSFSLNTTMSVQRFNQWRQKTDIRRLRTWSIGRINNTTLARTIGAVAPSFQRLERLELNLRETPRRSLVGNRNASFISKVLSRHGATLLSLGLDTRNIQHDVLTQRQTRPYYNAQAIARFASKCPVLRELHLTVHRVQGLAPEVKVYKALGRFSSLLHLCVKLHYFPSAGDPHDNVDPSTIPDYLSRYDFAMVRKARALYINAVMDDHLAESIFNTILSSQSTRRLASLRLFPDFFQPQNCNPRPLHYLSSNPRPGVLDIKRTRTAIACPVAELAPFSVLGRDYILEWIWPNDITSFPSQDA
ncbi:hypothetical protein KXV74_001654 [Aspergillus fumigatus]|uniref:Uncharacterized protein n=1 Tax=Aspergillus fumigatus TaxID=746128 RepID=A0A9P8NLS6_ASPFM|nr:hypothetical protein KXX69_008972 [Aspergillus fumigatus]KAH1859246.1 hypothetical protein KXX54_008202 [Aspergillus fumigatus]KAH1908271.1 hypothetical protein KXV57_003533 [Aspergillus fumigatus]KAH2055415.1 hypothetical protein KXW51_002483 [Aspergillus fumigatus]KAH2169161.1 hypothetical protein KXV74_001654 [Aspergillus fumigatus]